MGSGRLPLCQSVQNSVLPFWKGIWQQQKNHYREISTCNAVFVYELSPRIDLNLPLCSIFWQKPAKMFILAPNENIYYCEDPKKQTKSALFSPSSCLCLVTSLVCSSLYPPPPYIFSAITQLQKRVDSLSDRVDTINDSINNNFADLMERLDQMEGNPASSTTTKMPSELSVCTFFVIQHFSG